jgi:uncharacterized protein (DUF362 family)
MEHPTNQNTPGPFEASGNTDEVKDSSKSSVVVLKTRPETVVEDYVRAQEMAGLSQALDRTKPTILKDNISWHFAYPGANTTPWQLEAAIVGLRRAGYENLVCVQNKTVVTNAYKGERLNRYMSVFAKHDVEVRYNFKPEDMRWVTYEPKGELLVLQKIFPKGFLIPDFFFDKNIVHLPTVKTHIYTTTTGAMKNAFGGLLNTRRHYDDPEGDSFGHFRHHGRNSLWQRTRSTHHGTREERHHPRFGRFGRNRRISSEDHGFRSP